MRLSDPALLKRLSIIIVGMHSLVLGVGMLFAPIRFLSLAGWPYPPADDPFFASQSGVFLIILGVAYLAALRLFAGAPFQVMLLGGVDACMGLLVISGVMVEQSARARDAVGESAAAGK